MNWSLYLLFVVTASTTVATPGPGVLMTLMKSIQYGFRGARWTILGTATGTIIMGLLSATGIGILLSQSPTAYNTLRVIGAAYMVWLGIKNFRVKAMDLESAIKRKRLRNKTDKAEELSSQVIRPFPFFMEGITLQMTNPLLIMFFISLFPQFVDPTAPYLGQFIGLIGTYFSLVLFIHTIYSLVTSHYRSLLRSRAASQFIYRLGGTLFILLALFVLKSVVTSVWA